MRLLLALLGLLLGAAAAPPPVSVGGVRECAGAWCRPVDLQWLALQGREAVLERAVTVRADSLPLERPLMVRLVALASAEISWNGVVIGRNGVPGADAATERPGLFVASFAVPAALVRPGANIVRARLSAQHLWLPVRRVVHQFEIGPYESDPLPGLSDYLPALLALGALAGACIYFGTAFAGDRDRGALLLAAIAAAAMLQLLAEVSRAFIAYSYPWHLARVSLIALLAASIAVLGTTYAARRFAPEWRRIATRLTAGASVAALILIPYYDLKAMVPILVGTTAVGVCGTRGRRRGQRGASAAVAAALAVPALVAWQLTAFLDRAWYILVAALLVALVAEQVAALRRARAERDAETRRASALAERLARAERSGEAIVALKEGTRTYRVAADDILCVRAADDYCEALLAGGRVVLVTMTLARLLDMLPPRFLRVHKSYAVNRAHIASVAPKPGGGRLLRMSDGSSVPVGRSYAAATLAAIS